MDDQLSTCRQLMQQTIDSVDIATKSSNIRKLCSLINPEPPGDVWHATLVNDGKFEHLLELLVSNCIFPEVKEEFHAKYNKSHFKDYAYLSSALLDCVINYITLKSSWCTQGLTNESYECNEMTNHSSPTIKRPDHFKGFKLLPTFLILIGGNIRNPVWSSKDCQSKSKHLLDALVTFAKCCDAERLVTNDFHLQHDSILGMKIKYLKPKTILNVMFHLFEKPLSRQQWETNHYFCEVFAWLVNIVKSPHLSNHIDQIVATCLNFIQSHENDIKLDGLHCLRHLIQNTSREELTWYNRSEVLYETLKTQLYNKDSLVLDIATECIILNLKVLEKSCLEKAVKHQEIMSLLLSQCEMEQLLANRRVVMKYVAKFIVDYGILVTQHLSNILAVIESFLEIDDLPNQVARIQALQCLEHILSIAWPRIHQHSHHILQFLLKCVINMDNSQNNLANSELLQKASICVNMLLKVDPQLYSVIDEIKSAEELGCLHKLLGGLQK